MGTLGGKQGGGRGGGGRSGGGGGGGGGGDGGDTNFVQPSFGGPAAPRDPRSLLRVALHPVITAPFDRGGCAAS